MLEPIQSLPAGVTGVRARGTVTKHDYEAVLRPLLERAETTGQPVRLLYVFGSDFESFTAAAAWEDANLAFDHLDDVERCAVVSDRTRVSAASQLAGALTAARVRRFDSDGRDAAVAWLASDLPTPGSP